MDQRRYLTATATSAGAWADTVARAVGRVAYALRAHPTAHQIEVYRSLSEGRLRVEPVGVSKRPRNPALLVGRYSADVTLTQLIEDLDAALNELGHEED